MGPSSSTRLWFGMCANFQTSPAPFSISAPSRFSRYAAALVLIALTTMPSEAAMPAIAARAMLKMRYVGIHIDAQNSQDCREKGVDLVRAGKNPDLINEYCEARYDRYVFCTPKKLSSDELKSVEIVFKNHHLNMYGRYDTPGKDVYVQNNTGLHLIDIVFVAKDSSSGRSQAMKFALDHQPPGTLSGTVTSTQFDENTLTGRGTGLFDEVEIVAVTGCVP